LGGKGILKKNFVKGEKISGKKKRPEERREHTMGGQTQAKHTKPKTFKKSNHNDSQRRKSNLPKKKGDLGGGRGTRTEKKPGKAKKNKTIANINKASREISIPLLRTPRYWCGITRGGGGGGRESRKKVEI